MASLASSPLSWDIQWWPSLTEFLAQVSSPKPPTPNSGSCVAVDGVDAAQYSHLVGPFTTFGGVNSFYARIGTYLFSEHWNQSHLGVTHYSMGPVSAESGTFLPSPPITVHHAALMGWSDGKPDMYELLFDDTSDTILCHEDESDQIGCHLRKDYGRHGLAIELDKFELSERNDFIWSFMMSGDALLAR